MDNEDYVKEELDNNNPESGFITDGYRGTELTKQEWEDNYADINEK
jgi:hypothetical protein